MLDILLTFYAFFVCYRKRATWSKESLAAAVTGVMDKTIGLRSASRKYGIPKSTIKNHVDGKYKLAMGSNIHIGRPQMLPPKVEEELVRHILECESYFMGLTRKDVMEMAYSVARRNGLTTVFNDEKKSAGKKWFKHFMKRHPELSLRQPESTSFARARGFNADSVSNFFDLLEKQIDEKKLDSTRIYNVDETSVSTVQKKSQKIVSQKGKHQIGSVSSGERGQNTTVVCCMSAAGQYVPPLILFKRVRACNALSIGAPAGSLVTNNPSGWMDKDMFVTWLKHFVNNVHASQSNPVLLILDGHASHTRSLEAIEFASQHGVVLITLPPHATHKMQPLDVSFFKPLQTYYAQEQEKWLRTNREKKITTLQIAGLFNKAYLRAASAATACNGFEKTGIWPCNRDAFCESDFAPSANLDDFEVYMSTSQYRATPCEQESPSTIQAETPPASTEPNGQSPSSEQQVNEPAEITTPQESSSPIQVETPPAFTEPNGQSPSSEQQVNEPAEINTPQVQCLALPGQSVIQTNPDGRCFFRSIVVGKDLTLQEADRDENDLLLDHNLRLKEQIKSDMLRSQMTQHMIENMQEYIPLQGSVNVDMPMTSGQHFQSLEERICHMTNPKAAVGELEILATSRVLKQPIHVVMGSDGRVSKYSENAFQGVEPAVVLYKSFGDNSGHYDCIIKSECVSIIRPTPSPVAQISTVKNRHARKTESVILTSTPYKRKLAESLNKTSNKKTAKKRLSIPKEPVKKSKKQKNTKSTPSATATSWYCFICTENTQEDMIQCSACKQWVHVDCGGAQKNQISYTCDICHNSL